MPPASIPDYLALVGDAADGYPGLPGWGAKSAAAVLARFGHLESIPEDWRDVGRERGQCRALSLTLARERDLALLFRDLATLRTDIPLFDSVDAAAMGGADVSISRFCRAVRRRGHGALSDPETLRRSDQFVASAFRRKAVAGRRLPPEGGSHKIVQDANESTALSGSVRTLVPVLKRRTLMAEELRGKRVAALVDNGFEQSELVEPKKSARAVRGASGCSFSAASESEGLAARKLGR